MILLSDIHINKNPQFDLLASHIVKQSPEICIIAGDLTQSATPDEFKTFASFIKLLIHAGTKVLCVPGNHDIFRKSYYLNPYRAKQLYKELILPLLTGQNDVTYSHDLDVIYTDPLFDIVGMNSARSFHWRHNPLGEGFIKERQLAWMDPHLSEKPARLRIFFCHHSLWSGHHRSLRHHHEVESFLSRHKFTHFIHGHNHELNANYERCDNIKTPLKQFSIQRIQIPTTSVRHRGNPRGYFIWKPTQAELQFIRV